jgi:hypothetical protein
VIRHQIHDIVDLLSRINPVSTCGSIGWLNRSDVRRLSSKLHEVCDKQPAQLKVFEELLAMLTGADSQETGLCIVLSG